MNLFKRKKRGPKVEIWRARNGRWYFHRIAANGKITDSSQGYTRKQSAKRGVERRWPGIPVVELDGAGARS